MHRYQPFVELAKRYGSASEESRTRVREEIERWHEGEKARLRQMIQAALNRALDALWPASRAPLGEFRMDDLIDLLIREGKLWVESQRSGHRNQGTGLNAQDGKALAPFFPAAVMQAVRICRVTGIENPPFYASLQQAGYPIPLDFRVMEAITFVDTILAQTTVPPSRWISLLFHECVHASQYRLLGMDLFVEQYVSGWAANGFDYASIPLEQDAYQLQARFASDPRLEFSVEAELQRRFESRGITAR